MHFCIKDLAAKLLNLRSKASLISLFETDMSSVKDISSLLSPRIILLICPSSFSISDRASSKLLIPEKAELYASTVVNSSKSISSKLLDTPIEILLFLEFKL